MIIRIKRFSAADVLKKHPTIPISLATLGVSATNLAVNSKRHKAATEYQKKQLDAMGKLTDAMAEVNDSLIEEQRLRREDLEDRVKFRKLERDSLKNKQQKKRLLISRLFN